MRPRICRKSVGVKWLSASWRMKYRACRMRRPPVFEEPLLETRQGPVLDGHGENEPAQEIAEVVGDHPEEQPHLIGPEPVTGEAGPVGGGLALLDPLLGRPALVVEADDCSVRPQRGDDEAYSGKQFTEVMLDLGDHAARAVPGRR